ncbi:hypothetical protein [Polaribacter staleyi]|uniref:hypothetical protein n=1 Tax=Polaribacter staleyi TaxID=2022337 RepID=UPI0031BB755C
MKNKILLPLCFLVAIISSAQIKSIHFIGNWKIVKEDFNKDFIILKKNVKGFGSAIILFDQYKIRETFSAPCGNDIRFFSSVKKGVGNWMYNDKDKIFISSIPILCNEKRFKLIAFYDNKIVLKPIRN